MSCQRATFHGGIFVVTQEPVLFSYEWMSLGKWNLICRNGPINTDDSAAAAGQSASSPSQGITSPDLFSWLLLLASHS